MWHLKGQTCQRTNDEQGPVLCVFIITMIGVTVEKRLVEFNAQSRRRAGDQFRGLIRSNECGGYRGSIVDGFRGEMTTEEWQWNR